MATIGLGIEAGSGRASYFAVVEVMLAMCRLMSQHPSPRVRLGRQNIRSRSRRRRSLGPHTGRRFFRGLDSCNSRRCGEGAGVGLLCHGLEGAGSVAGSEHHLEERVAAVEWRGIKMIGTTERKRNLENPYSENRVGSVDEDSVEQWHQSQGQSMGGRKET